MRLVVMAAGHAHTAQAGQDTVCAAVSILVYGLAEQLGRLDEKYFRYRRIDVEEKGRAEIVTDSMTSAGYMRVLDYMEPIERALEALAEQYPQAINLHRHGERPKNLGPEWLRLWDIE